jgi:hypothetical protein
MQGVTAWSLCGCNVPLKNARFKEANLCQFVMTRATVLAVRKHPMRSTWYTRSPEGQATADRKRYKLSCCRCQTQIKRATIFNHHHQSSHYWAHQLIGYERVVCIFCEELAYIIIQWWHKTEKQLSWTTSIIFSAVVVVSGDLSWNLSWLI